MVSFIKLGIFEREAKTPALNTRQLALLLCGLDPELKTQEIPTEMEKPYNIYYRHIGKWMNTSGLFRGGNSSLHDADKMFALAYPMIDDDLTPQPIKDRCLRAVAIIASKNNGKETLLRLGGEELSIKGAELSKNQRGMHRKEDERANTDILLGLLVKLLAKKVGHSYGTIEKPQISTIYNELCKLADEEGIPLTGLSKSTIYAKIRNSISSITYLINYIK
ncbi:hypothetical protein AB204_09575 [Xenorhabdus khoisanae]|uniref:Uncharacterized protein n=1 Tax=Xenorhabdus khoisanae TaxID=880157 RepID=A0A0J5FTP5_9GAMM|nr:hypothetical protein [Xenorhabdus khoisanae]KMJ45312.1 hypothetical protein AB204_09575 [Xenorhabdus khoisanae]